MHHNTTTYWYVCIFFSIFLVLSTTQIANAGRDNTQIHWQTWSQQAFDQAKKNNKLVLLNLEAVWCHWCHVMDQQTYSDTTVAAIIQQHYIPIKVDHDARPDLAQRYRDYGWPATIVLNADGTEIVKRAGFIKPENFSRLLQAIIKDPSPEAAAAHFEPDTLSSTPTLPKTLKKQLLERRYKTYDPKLGGYKNAMKFLDEAYTEYAMTFAAKGNKDENTMAVTTLNAALALIDPVWGGAYQYSTYGDWQHPHYEKIMTTQARYIKLYARAYAQWQNPKYLAAAKAVADYMTTFLMDPNGAFYTSQDADLVQGKKSHEFFTLDDKARRKQGIPRIDKNQYAQENGWAIEAFATLYEASADPEYLQRAVTAAQWIIANRRITADNADTLGFSHADINKQNNSADSHYYLGDNLAMAKAFLQLHRATAQRQWLHLAIQTTRFIDQHFRKNNGGFTSATSTLSPVPPSINSDENMALVRFCNLLFHYTGQQRFKAMAEHGMLWLVTPSVALERIEESGILLADDELTSDPIHLTVVGHKNDKIAQQLYKQALLTPGYYKRIEWWDRREGPLANPDIEYPQLEQSAAFVCTNGRCSLPAFEAAKYKKNIERLLQ